MRSLLIHYHIFKNSGSTFEYALKRAFGKAFLAVEAPAGSAFLAQEELARRILAHPRVSAISSHTARLPAPQIDGVRVLPVVFLRHPLLRTRSVYNFFSRPSRRERVWALLGRKPVQPGSLAARLARGSGSFQDWVQEMIASEEGLTYLSNPQTRFLGGGLNTPARRLPHTGRGRLFDLDQAMANLSQVALLARTEHFDSDVRRFAPTLAASDLDLDLEGMVPRNITSDDFRAPLADRLRRLESQLGEALTEALYELQEQDSALYAWAGRRLDSV